MSTPVKALSVRNYGASHGSHAHEHFQILLGLDGILELEVNGRGCRIGLGDGCVIPPGARHDFEAAAGSSRCLVLDSGDSRWQEARGHQHHAAFAHLAPYLEMACAQGLARAHRLGPDLLLEAWGAHANQRQHMRRPIHWSQLTEWALAHAHLNLQVRDLAARTHLSAAQFTARCLDEQGTSPMDWLRGLRLDLATRYRQSGLSVAEAARRVGYRSPSALTAAQRRRSGR